MFSRSDRNNILIITAIIIAVNMGFYLYSRYDKPQPEPLTNANTGTDASGDANATKKSNESASHSESHAPQLFPFNPNTADSATLAQLPINPSAVKAIIHYRQAGGQFRKPTDLARIYTLSEEEYLALEPYIRIPAEKTSNRNSYNHANAPTSPSTSRSYYQPKESTRTNTTTYPSYPQQHKTNAAHSIDIATADTAQLKTIPGIGTYYAGKIIRYRERLGGFVNLSQLKEIEGLPADINTWVKLSNTPIHKLKINLLTFGQLLRHPYIDYEQVKAIFNHRRQQGPIRSFDDLRTYPAFSATDFARLTPYVDFSIN